MSRITEVILTSDTTGESWSAAVWDPRNGSMLSVFKNASALGHRTLQLLSDSYILGASATKSRLYIWPLNSPSPLSNIHLTTTGKMNALTCTPNGSYLIASVDEKIFIWQTCNGRMLANLVRHYQTINCLAITKDGSFFASAGEDGYVFVWSLYKVLNANKHDRLPVYTFSHHTMPIKDMLFGFGGARTRLYTVSLDAKCNIYELGSGDLLLSLIFDVPLTAITVNSRESEFFVGCTTGDIFQCNLHEPPREIVLHVKNEETAVFRAHKSHVTALSVSVDCRTLLSGSTDGAVHIWDIVSRQVLRTIEHKGPVTAAFFTKGFENFRASTLEPRLEVHSLERVSETDDNESNDVIKVISRGRNPAEILDFQSYVGNTVDSSEQEKLIKQLTDLKEEINKLEKINASLFKYGVTYILQKTNDE